jgi:hypothetical protein
MQQPSIARIDFGCNNPGGHFKEDFNYGAKDIRFTTKGATLDGAFGFRWKAKCHRARARCRELEGDRPSLDCVDRVP